MSDEFDIVLEKVIQRLGALIVGDAELVAGLRIVAQHFLTVTEPPPAPPEAPEPVEAAVEVVATEEIEPTIVVPVAPQHEPLPSVPGVEVPIGWARRVSVADSDLQLIEARCRLKAEGSSWAATRRRKIADGCDFYTEIEPKDREIISKAKSLPDCFLWMNHPTGPCPQDLTLWDDVCGCFETAAAAVALLREVVGDIDGNREIFEQALDLAAEAQSALRIAIEAVGGRPDTDQTQLFKWLRSAANENQTFIRRYMRIDDPADPKSWPSIQERIDQLDSEIQKIRFNDKERRRLLKQAQYHARVIQQGHGSEHDWRKVTEAVERLVGDGVPASNVDLRELLLPIVEDMPDLGQLPPGVRSVLVEIDRYLATRVPMASETVQEISAEVKQVAGRLRGRGLVLIGGDRRPHSYDALKAAFGLCDLTWIETREHQSIEGFEAYVARPEVAVVVLAIRWSSHSFGEVKDFCDKHGKPLVRLPAGYNPNQVAHQILQQCFDRLAPVAAGNGRR